MKVSVILPVYNAERYVSAAIESILRQTLTDFELLLINDASTDSSRAILESYAAQDKRIRLIDNPHNLGLTATLNKAIDLCQGQYIARMDADDISLPERFAFQVNFLDKNLNIDFCGTWAAIIDSKGRLTGEQWVMRLTPELICARMYFHNCFVHASVMMRRCCAQEKYDPAYNFIEDFELWLRLIKKYRAALIPRVLLHYRTHQSNITVIRKNQTQQLFKNLIQRELLELGLAPSEEELALHIAIGHQELIPEPDFVQAAHQWLIKLLHAFKQRYQSYPELNQAMRQLLSRFWLAILSQPDLPKETAHHYALSPLSRLVFSKAQLIKNQLKNMW